MVYAPRSEDVGRSGANILAALANGKENAIESTQKPNRIENTIKVEGLLGCLERTGRGSKCNKQPTIHKYPAPFCESNLEISAGYLINCLDLTVL